MSLKNLTTTELQRELARRQKNASKLETKRRKLLEQLAEVDKELAALGSAPTSRGGGAPRGGGRRRARNEVSLPDAIAAAMELRAVVSPREAAELVKANGYKTNSKNFNMMVSNALSKDKRFKRLGRGQYERIG